MFDRYRARKEAERQRAMRVLETQRILSECVDPYSQAMRRESFESRERRKRLRTLKFEMSYRITVGDTAGAQEILDQIAEEFG